MARGIVRKPSFAKVVGAYRSQWKRFWMRLFGLHAPRGWGWLRNLKRALYNFWYYRTSVSIYNLLGCKPSRGSAFFAMLVAAVISICAAPVDAVSAGVKAHRTKKKRKKQQKKSKNKSETSKKQAHSQSTAPSKPKRENNPTVLRQYHTVPQKEVTPSVAKEEIYEDKFTPLFEKHEETSCASVTDCQETDENIPKSVPKNEKDQYIRKRMIIEGLDTCDVSALSKLSVGTYFDLVAETDNPDDKDAVMLVLDGEKIGYVSRDESFAFLTCLKLKRRMYGVITGVDRTATPEKYEFETWFEQ